MKIEDWGKFTTDSVKLPNGQSMQVHLYQNTKTGGVDYQTQDYKVTACGPSSMRTPATMPQLAAYYSQVFRNAGVKNFKFVITPTK